MESAKAKQSRNLGQLGPQTVRQSVHISKTLQVEEASLSTDTNGAVNRRGLYAQARSLHALRGCASLTVSPRKLPRQYQLDGETQHGNGCFSTRNYASL